MDLENISYEEKIKLAKNPNTSEDILQKLAQDPDGWLKGYVIANPSVSCKILMEMFEYEKNLKNPCIHVISCLYKHAKLPYIAKVIIETLFRDML